MIDTNLQQREQERPVIGGKYVLEKMLGQGGYSWVYLARHKNIENLLYVVKLLKPTHLGNDQVLRRFEQEATTLARIRSSRIARIVDYGPTENGIPYIVSEYIEGVTIGLILRENGGMSPWLTAHLGCQILEGLADAHAANVVHRDLKPDNVLITQEPDSPFPSAMILDFGIAKVTQDASEDADATVEGLACSPRYAAPEVLTKEPTYKSDIYAMGLVLAEMLQGHPVYQGKHNLILASEQLSSERVPLSDEVRTGPLGQIIAKACEKDQNKRYENVGLMLEDLKEMRQTLMPFSEAAKSEVDLPALMLIRDEKPEEDNDDALTENLHTFESTAQDSNAHNTVNIDVDTLVAAQKAANMNRVLMPLLILLIVGLIGLVAWIMLKSSPSGTGQIGAGNASTIQQAAGKVDVESAIKTAQNRVRSAVGQASVNRVSIVSTVENAELWKGNEKIANLPVKSLVTTNERPLEFTVRASGYEAVTLQIVQTGHVSLQVPLEVEGAAGDNADANKPRKVVRDTPQRKTDSAPPPAASQGSSSSSGSSKNNGNNRRRGDYFDNPF